MKVSLHPHARDRLDERGAEEDEVITTVKWGEQFPAKFGRTGFRRNFTYNRNWKGKHYATKQIEAFGVKEEDGWTVITIVVKFF